MTGEPVVAIFDFSNFAYTAFFKTLTSLQIKPEDARDPFEAHIGTFASKVNDCLAGLYWTDAYYVMEGRSRKYAIFPEYKAKRKTKQLQVDPKMPLYGLLRAWNSKILWHPEEEADDVISSYVAQNFDQKFVIFSTDKDLWQLLDHDNVSIFDPFKRIYITREHVKAEFDLSEPSKIKLHKMLWGDTSDNIPNLMPRMKAPLLPLVEACDGTLEDLTRLISTASLSKRCMELLEENGNLFDRNLQLTSLSFRAKPKVLTAGEWYAQEEKRLKELEAERKRKLSASHGA